MKKKTRAVAPEGYKRPEIRRGRAKAAPGGPRTSAVGGSPVRRRPPMTPNRPSGGCKPATGEDGPRVVELEATADTDFLLDTLNRRGFEREFARAIAFIKRYCASGALIVLDVDRLKPINDSFGHAAGRRGAEGDRATLAARSAPPT